jgi:beta-galactosidase
MSVKRLIWFLFVTIGCFGQEGITRIEQNKIDSDWLYLEKDSKSLPAELDKEYQEINLPHTWNAIDAVTKNEYRKASSWYRKNVLINKEDLAKRIYIRFGAAGQEAEVYLNGNKIKYHAGGYSAFVCELTNKLNEGLNKIDVRVSNKKTSDLAPLSADYNFYGGLYRSVSLIKTPNLSFSKNDYAGPGVRVWSENVDRKKVDIYVLATIDNGEDKNQSVSVEAKVFDKKGKIISKGKQKIKIAANTSTDVAIDMSKVVKPNLWSPENPELYRVEISLVNNKKLVEKINVNHGFRWFQFTADKGFFLNGNPYKLNGMNRHQDYFKEGNALSLNRHLDDIKLMKELGVNWLRLAHYQQDDYVLDLCDSLGILVWEEIPYVNNTPKSKKFKDNLESMMTDLIHQHFNHSSIILWGMGNEVWMGDRGDGKATNYHILTDLNNLIHKEDPTRKTVFVNGDNNRPIDLDIINIPDVFGYNLYRGWYGTHFSTLTSRLNEIHKKAPNRPLILSEFGAGSDTRIHSETPLKQDFSIEYQNDYIISHLNQTEKMDWLSGVNYWSFADFGAAHRGDSKPHINQKGLVTFDRKKKDAFYIVKSRWTKEPVVYLESPFWTERSGDLKKTYRVFSNMEEVDLFHNGKSLGKKKKDFIWEVVLNKGKNNLLAKGKSGKITKEHGFSVLYKNKKFPFEIKASQTNKGFPVTNLIDGKKYTHWSSKKESVIELDLGRISLVNGVSINVTQGKKIKTYNLEIKGSSDGKNWTSFFVGKTAKNKNENELLFHKQAEIRYLKIEANGNNSSKSNSYNEVTPLITLEKKELNLYEKIGAGKD